METTDFARIFKDAGSITWKNRFLWWLGLLMFVGSGLSNISYGGNNNKTASSQENMTLLEFIQRHMAVVAAGALLIVIGLLALWAVGIMSRATMIKAVNNLETYRNMKLGALIRLGANYFWKLFFTEIAFGIAIFLFILLLVVPVIALFHFGAWIAGIFVAFWAVAILIPILFMVYVMRQYAILFIVLADFAIFQSVRMSYGLLKKKMSESLVMALWMIFMGIVFGFTVVCSLLVTAIVFVLLGFIMYVLLSKIGIYITASAGILLWLGLVLFAGSLYETFKQTVWVLLFKEISMIKADERIENMEKVSQAVPSPEAV